MQNEKKDTVTKNNHLENIVYIFSFLISFLTVKFLGFKTFLILLLILGVPAIIGFLFSNWCIARNKINSIFVESLAWSNLITWLLPPIGLLTAFATIGFSSNSIENGIKYKILGILGIILSLVNAGAGIAHQL